MRAALLVAGVGGHCERQQAYHRHHRHGAAAHVSVAHFCWAQSGLTRVHCVGLTGVHHVTCLSAASTCWCFGEASDLHCRVADWASVPYSSIKSRLGISGTSKSSSTEFVGRLLRSIGWEPRTAVGDAYSGARPHFPDAWYILKACRFPRHKPVPSCPEENDQRSQFLPASHRPTDEGGLTGAAAAVAAGVRSRGTSATVALPNVCASHAAIAFPAAAQPVVPHAAARRRRGIPGASSCCLQTHSSTLPFLIALANMVAKRLIICRAAATTCACIDISRSLSAWTSKLPTRSRSSASGLTSVPAGWRPWSNSSELTRYASSHAVGSPRPALR